MINKKVLAASLFSASLLLLSSTVALADNPVTAGSKGRVKFTEATGKEAEPFDPTDPDFPPAAVESNEEGEGKGTFGVLRFERVPNFEFTDLAIVPTSQTANVKDESYTRSLDKSKFYAAPTVEITDGRGNAPGWTASVMTDGIFTVKDKEDTIPSIKGVITLNNGVAQPYTEGVALAEAPTLTNELKLSDQFQTFAIAEAGFGNASWGISYYKGTELEDEATNNSGKPGNHGTTQKESDAITLTVPSGQKITKGEVYTTSITWQLSDTPDK